MDWFICAGVTLGLSLLWLASSLMAGAFPALENRRITLLIAHPDDEAMFFAPTVLALTNPKLGNHVSILCVSSGNAEGLGHIRTQEIVKSAALLGIVSPEANVQVIQEDDVFADSMTATWPAREISDLLLEHIDNTKTDTIITFDQDGVSSHPNHKSLYLGVLAYVSERQKRKPVTVYALTTTNLLRKYGSLLDAPLTVLRVLFDTVRSSQAAASQAEPERLLFISGAREYARARRAMTQAHKSQMMWFRYFWIGLSRYMVMNDLRLIKPIEEAR